MSADEQQSNATALDVAEAVDATTEAIVDQERSEKILKAKELYSQGSRNFLVKSYAESADELSQVCALYEELYGPLADELGMPYLLYAKSLIALALDENKVIDVPDEEDDDDDDDVDDDDEDIGADADVSGAVAKNGEATARSTNGSAQKLDAIKEVESSSAIKAKSDEADSTENSGKEKSTEDENKSKNDTERSDEAMVTSTENGSTTDEPDKKCTSSNGKSTLAEAVDGEKPSTSNGADATAPDDDDDENEAASSLQLAWEILELAAKIFSRQGLSGLPNLAEVQTELANIEFENNILDAARDDYGKALKIYGELPSNYRRAMAEIHYKIGLTYLMETLNKQGAESLKQACNLIEEEISDIQEKEEVTEKDKNNIQDMEETKQEIMAKIVEIQEMQAQQIADVRAALDKVINPATTESADGAGPSSSSSTSNAADASSSSSAAITSSSKPTDISHLIKRKKPEEPHSEAEAASPAKRPAV